MVLDTFDNIALLGAYSNQPVEGHVAEEDLWCNYFTVSERGFREFNAQINEKGYFLWFIVIGDQFSKNFVTHVAIIDKCTFEEGEFEFYNRIVHHNFEFHVNKMVRLDENQRFRYVGNMIKFFDNSPVNAARGTVYVKEIDMSNQFGRLHQVLPIDHMRNISGVEFYDLQF